MIKRLVKKTVTAAAVAGILVSCSGPAKNKVDMTDVDLVVRELSFNAQQPTAAQIEEAFNAKNVEYSSIACANWPSYNGDYNPDVKFRIGYTPEEIYIQYLVTENDIKAEFGEDAANEIGGYFLLIPTLASYDAIMASLGIG